METTVGFAKEAPSIAVNGFNVYHKNRLIRVSFGNAEVTFPCNLVCCLCFCCFYCVCVYSCFCLSLCMYLCIYSRFLLLNWFKPGTFFCVTLYQTSTL